MVRIWSARLRGAESRGALNEVVKTLRILSSERIRYVKICISRYPD
jgi:hypothetical protein